MKTNCTMPLIALFFSIVLLANDSRADAIVTIVESPQTPYGYFSARIAGLDVNDPRPNPCNGTSHYTCSLRFFTISESWLPNGISNYGTGDAGFKTRSGNSNYKTLGEWWADVTDKDRIGRDYLRKGSPLPACTVLAAYDRNGKMILGSIVSNCARGLVTLPTCSLLPENIVIPVTVNLHQTDKTSLPVTHLSFECDTDTDAKIETNTGELIPINGSTANHAVLNWGAGDGKPLVLTAKAGIPRPIELTGYVFTPGLDAGEYTGNAVVNITYP